MTRTRWSLECLALGDAFGERFFHCRYGARNAIASRYISPAPWQFTDDTVMAISVVEILGRFGSIDQDQLALAFAERYMRAPQRGYGRLAHRILHGIAEGARWQDLSRSAFGGQGSLGNGAAMRAAPIGAYFEGDPERAAEQADLSAEVTHAHHDGRAGAVAVAVAASVVARNDAATLFDIVLSHTPAGETRAGIESAAALPLASDPQEAAKQLGSGDRIISQDTVPYSIWCAARHRDSYEEGMWSTVSGLGDRDTTCAIVGGIIASSIDKESVPQDWLEAREELSAME